MTNERRKISTKYVPPGGSTPSPSAEPSARKALTVATIEPPEGKATQVPVRLYPRQIGRLDALRRTLTPGHVLTRTEALRFMIDNWS